MDPFVTPERSWWRKRRWRLVFGLWLAWPLFYALASGPLAYCYARGWIAPSTWRQVYPIGFRLSDAYVGLWWSHGRYHDQLHWSEVARVAVEPIPSDATSESEEAAH